MKSCPVKCSLPLAKGLLVNPHTDFWDIHLHRFFSIILSHKFQLFQQPGTVIFAFSAHSALALSSYVIVGMNPWQKTGAIMGFVLCFLSLKNYSPMLPIVICLKTIASYIWCSWLAFIAIERQARYQLFYHCKTKVSEHILLKPF